MGVGGRQRASAFSRSVENPWDPSSGFSSCFQGYYRGDPELGLGSGVWRHHSLPRRPNLVAVHRTVCFICCCVCSTHRGLSTLGPLTAHWRAPMASCGWGWSWEAQRKGWPGPREQEGPPGTWRGNPKPVCPLGAGPDYGLQCKFGSLPGLC